MLSFPSGGEAEPFNAQGSGAGDSGAPGEVNTCSVHFAWGCISFGAKVKGARHRITEYPKLEGAKYDH